MNVFRLTNENYLYCEYPQYESIDPTNPVRGMEWWADGILGFFMRDGGYYVLEDGQWSRHSAGVVSLIPQTLVPEEVLDAWVWVECQ